LFLPSGNPFHRRFSIWFSLFHAPNVRSNGVKNGFTKGVLVIRPDRVHHALADATCCPGF
jgi:hypothetical protein